MLTIVMYRLAPWLGPELGGLMSQPAGTSLRTAASDTLNAMPMRLSTLLPESFSWPNADATKTSSANDSKARMVYLPRLSHHVGDGWGNQPTLKASCGPLLFQRAGIALLIRSTMSGGTK